MKWIRNFLVLIVLIQIWNCSKLPMDPINTQDPNAENPLVEGASTETVVGQVVLTDSTPAANVSYIVRESNYLLEPGNLISSTSDSFAITGTTDSLGNFYLDSLGAGDYVVEIYDGESTASIVQFTIEEKPDSIVDDTIPLPVSTLTATGSIKGIINPATAVNLDSTFKVTHVRIFGMEKGSTVDSTGFFFIEGIPEGRYHLRAETDYPIYQSFELAGILVHSGDTVDVGTLQLTKVAAHIVTDLVPSGLVAYWPLDEWGGNIVMDVTGINSGTIFGNITWSPGVYNGAILLDGQGAKIKVPTMYLNEDFTISSWVYLRESITNQDALLSHVIISGQLPRSSINFHDGKIRLYAGESAVIRDPLISTTKFPGGNWAHLAFTRESDSLKLFINGTLDTVVVWVGTFSFNTIGEGMPGTFDGFIDDLRVYNRAITAEEIGVLHSTNLN